MLNRFIGVGICLMFWNTSFAYPGHWWDEVSPEEKKRWEITPDQAERGKEVILSKRNELGQFSNLAKTPFDFEGESYASIEALWQMMKFPDLNDSDDPRKEWVEYKFTRDQVKQMYGFESKKAGNHANWLMKKKGIRWISYKGQRFNYMDHWNGSDLHYKIISSAIREKVEQTPGLKALLLSTKGLRLLPDHKISFWSPDSFRYHIILEELRREYLQKTEK